MADSRGKTGAEFTPKQASTCPSSTYYTKLNRVAPAEADFVRYFEVSAPSVHMMIKKLQADGWISRTPGQARSIRLRISRDQLPDLE
ncbi:MAG TPA: helix-turn-helix domain-containing protein [Longimicrobium sp.]|nr:helix-turn-helix domain-containing protein [Longimicrobium sp.]